MQGLDLISNLSMGLPGVNLDFSRLILGCLKKILARYNVATRPKAFVKKNFKMNLKFFPEHGFLGNYKRFSLETWIRFNLGYCECFMQVSDCFAQTQIFYEFFFTLNFARSSGGHCPKIGYFFYRWIRRYVNMLYTTGKYFSRALQMVPFVVLTLLMVRSYGS